MATFKIEDLNQLIVVLANCPEMKAVEVEGENEEFSMFWTDGKDTLISDKVQKCIYGEGYCLYQSSWFGGRIGARLHIPAYMKEDILNPLYGVESSSRYYGPILKGTLEEKIKESKKYV